MSEVKTNKLTGVTTANSVTVTVGASVTQILKTGLVNTHWLANQNSSEIRGVATNTTGSRSINVSSFSDDGTGDYTVTYTNNYADSQYSAASASHANNKNACYDTNSTSSTLIVAVSDADSATEQDLSSSWLLAGDLA